MKREGIDMVTKRCAAIGLFGVVLLGGCSGLSAREKGALTGGAIGAGTGALIGGVTGGSAAGGALLGGAGGAVGGYLLGDKLFKNDPSRAGGR